VGTGFHPELTGRENIYLNGAILGMRKAEIDRKFEEIVAFAEVEKFIDTPVKHYSSGMHVRLAFAVAAHLEPEILLVDEVLAVGDASFQKKSLGKMGDVARGGRTILFVSHSMAAINALCPRAILLGTGQVLQDGPTSQVTAQYHVESLTFPSNGSNLREIRRTGTGKAIFSSITIQPRSPSGEQLVAAYPGCDLKLDLEIESVSDILDSNVAVVIYDMNGYRLIDTNIAQKGRFLSLKAGQKVRASFHLREVLLKPGMYLVGLWLGRDTMEEIDNIEHATMFEIVESPETTRHVVVFPGPYLCRFDSSVTFH
jgi:lipopolysaccharide transport system ATP-binding protein